MTRHEGGVGMMLVLIQFLMLFCKLAVTETTMLPIVVEKGGTLPGRGTAWILSGSVHVPGEVHGAEATYFSDFPPLPLTPSSPSPPFRFPFPTFLPHPLPSPSVVLKQHWLLIEPKNPGFDILETHKQHY